MSKNGGNKTAAFIVGAAVGTIAALMFAPFSGKKMRRITKEKGKQALDDAKVKYSDFEEKKLKPNLLKAKLKGQEILSKTSHEAKERAADLKDEVSERAGELKEKANDKVISLRSRMSRKSAETEE
jgi:gas vesicle protein